MKATYTTKVQKLIGGLKAEPPEGEFRKRRDAVLAKCAEKYDSYVTITFSTPHRPRSKGQQGLLHDWFQDIAEATGNDMGHVKMALKVMAMSEGWPMQRDLEGNPVIDPLTGDPSPMSEADASVEEESILLKVTERFAAEYGIHLEKGAAA